MSPLLSEVISFTDDAVAKLLLRTMGFDPKTVSATELRKLVDQLPILSDIESQTISLLIQICSTFFEDSTKISEFYDDVIDLLRLGTDPNVIITKVNEALDSSRSSQERFHEAFSRMKDNVVVMRWRNTFLSDELRAAEAALKLQHDELDNADRDADALAQDNTIMVERVARLEAFIARLLEEKGRELAQRDAQIDTLERQCGVEAERCRDISDANEVLRAQLSSCRESESALRARAEQLAERVSELSAAVQVARARAETLEARASVENAQHIHENHEVARGLTALEEQLAEARTHVQVLSEERASLDAERLSLSTQLAALTVAWEQASQSLKEQGTSVTSMFRDNKTLKQDLRRVRDKHRAVLAKAAAREAQLQKRIRAAEAARASLLVQVQVLEAKVERAETDEREARAREEKLSTQVANLEAALSRAQADAAATHARAAQAEEELVVARAAANASDARTREVSSRAATAEAAAAQARVRVEEVAREIARVRQEAELQTQRALALEVEIQQLAQQRTALAQELDAATVATVALEARLEEQSDAVKEMRALDAQREEEAVELRAEREGLLAMRALLEASLQEVLADKATCALECRRLSSALEDAVARGELAAKSAMDARAAQEVMHAQLELAMEERAVVAEKHAAEAEKRAVVAEKHAAEAEKRAVVAEKHAAEAEERVVVAEKHAAEAEERVVVAEKHAAEAEDRVVVAEKHAAEAEDRAVVAEKHAAEAGEEAIRKQLAVDASVSALAAAERLTQALRAEAATATSLQRVAEDERAQLLRSVRTSAALEAALTARVLGARRAEEEAREAAVAADLRVEAATLELAMHASELQMCAALRDVAARQEHELVSARQVNDQLRGEVRDATAAAAASAKEAAALLARAVAAEEAHERSEGQLQQAQQALQHHAERVQELGGHLASLQADLHAREYRPSSRDTHAARSGHARGHMPSVLATLHEDVSGDDADEPSGLPLPAAPEAVAGPLDKSAHLDALFATALGAAEERFLGVHRAAHAMQDGLLRAQSDARSASRALANAQSATKSAQAELATARAEASHHRLRAQALDAEVERALGELSDANEQLERIRDGASMLRAVETQLAERNGVLAALCSLLAPELQEAERQERQATIVALAQRQHHAPRVLAEHKDVLHSAQHTPLDFARLPVVVTVALQERDERLRRVEEALVQARADNAAAAAREEHAALSRAGAEQVLREQSQTLGERETVVLAREAAVTALEEALRVREEAAHAREVLSCDAAARLSAREAAVCERMSLLTRTAEEELQRVLDQSVAVPFPAQESADTMAHAREAVALEARLEERVAALEEREASLHERTQTVQMQAASLLAREAQWATAATRAMAAETAAHEAMTQREAAVRREVVSVLQSAELVQAREAVVADDRAQVERLFHEVALREASLQIVALDLQRVRSQAAETCLMAASREAPVAEAPTPEPKAECAAGEQPSSPAVSGHASAEHMRALPMLLAGAQRVSEGVRALTLAARGRVADGCHAALLAVGDVSCEADLPAYLSRLAKALCALSTEHASEQAPRNDLNDLADVCVAAHSAHNDTPAGSAEVGLLGAGGAEDGQHSPDALSPAALDREVMCGTLDSSPRSSTQPTTASFAAAHAMSLSVPVPQTPQTPQTASTPNGATHDALISDASVPEDIRGVVNRLECTVAQLRGDLDDALHAQADALAKVRAGETVLRLRDDAQVELEAVVCSLNARVTQLTLERREVSKKLLATKAALAGMQVRAATLEQAHDAAIGDHQREVILAAVRIRELEDECSHLGHLLAQRTATLQTVQAAHAALDAQARASASALGELRARCAALETQVHDAHVVAVEHHATCTALEAEVSLVEVMCSAKAREEAEVLQAQSELRAADARVAAEAVEAHAEALRAAAMAAAAQVAAVEARANEAAALAAADATVLRMRVACAGELALEADEATTVRALAAARAAECQMEGTPVCADRADSARDLSPAAALALEQRCEALEREAEENRLQQSLALARMEELHERLRHAQLALQAAKRAGREMEQRAVAGEARVATTEERLEAVRAKLALTLDQLAEAVDRAEDANDLARAFELQLAKAREEAAQTMAIARKDLEHTQTRTREVEAQLDEAVATLHQMREHVSIASKRAEDAIAAQETATALAIQLKGSLDERECVCTELSARTAVLQDRVSSMTKTADALRSRVAELEAHPGVQLSYSQLAGLHARDAQATALERELARVREEARVHEVANAAAQRELVSLRRDIAAQQATAAQADRRADARAQLAALTRTTADKAVANAAALHARLSDSARAAVAATGAVVIAYEHGELYRQRAASAQALLRNTQARAPAQAPLSADTLSAAERVLLEEELCSARAEETTLAAALTSAETAAAEQAVSLATLNDGVAAHTARYDEACDRLARAHEELKRVRVANSAGAAGGDADTMTMEAALLGCLAEAEHAVCLAGEQLTRAIVTCTATQSVVDVAHDHALDVAHKYHLCVRRLALLAEQLGQREACAEPDCLVEQPDTLQRLQSCVAERELELELARAELATVQQEHGATRTELQMARRLLQRAEDRHLALQQELQRVRAEAVGAKEDAAAQLCALRATEAAAERHASESASASVAQAETSSALQECRHNLVRAEMAAAEHLRAAVMAQELQVSLEDAVSSAHAQLDAAQLAIQDAAVKHATLLSDLDVITLQGAMAETILQDALECECEEDTTSTIGAAIATASAPATDDALAALSLQMKRISALTRAVTARLCASRATMRQQQAAAHAEVQDARATLAQLQGSLSTALADADAECAEERAARLAAERRLGTARATLVRERVEHGRVASAADERVEEVCAALAEAQRAHEVVLAEAQQRALAQEQALLHAAVRLESSSDALSHTLQRASVAELQLSTATTRIAAVAAERDVLAARGADAAAALVALQALVRDLQRAAEEGKEGERVPCPQCALTVPLSRATSVSSAHTAAHEEASEVAQSALQAAAPQQAQAAEVVNSVAAEADLRDALAQACAERDAAVAAHRLLCGQALLLEKRAHTASTLLNLGNIATDALCSPCGTDMHAQAVLALEAVSATLVSVCNRAEGYLSCLRMLYPQRGALPDSTAVPGPSSASAHALTELPSQALHSQPPVDTADANASGLVCPREHGSQVQLSASASSSAHAACTCAACQRAAALEQALEDALMVARECLYQTALARQSMPIAAHTQRAVEEEEEALGYRVAGASLAHLLDERELGDLAAVLRELEATETGVRGRLPDTLLENVAEDECSSDAGEDDTSASDSSVSPSPSARSMQSHFEFAHEQDTLDALLGADSQVTPAAYSFVGICVHDDESENAAQSMNALPPHMRHLQFYPPTRDPCAAYGGDAAAIERMMDARLAAASGAPVPLSRRLAALVHGDGTCPACGEEECDGACEEEECDGACEEDQCDAPTPPVRPVQQARFVWEDSAADVVVSAQQQEQEQLARLARGERPSPYLPPLPAPVGCGCDDLAEADGNLFAGSDDSDDVDATHTHYISTSGAETAWPAHYWDGYEDGAPVLMPEPHASLEGHVQYPYCAAEAEAAWVDEPHYSAAHEPQLQDTGVPEPSLCPALVEAHAMDAHPALARHPSSAVSVSCAALLGPAAPQMHAVHAGIHASAPAVDINAHTTRVWVDDALLEPTLRAPPHPSVLPERATQQVCAAVMTRHVSDEAEVFNDACPVPRVSVQAGTSPMSAPAEPCVAGVAASSPDSAEISEKTLLALRPLALTPQRRASRPSALPSPRHSRREALADAGPAMGSAMRTTPTRGSAARVPEATQARRARMPTSPAVRGRARSVSAVRAPVSRRAGDTPPVRPSSVMAASPARLRSSSSTGRSPTPTPLAAMRAHLEELSTGLLDQVVTVVAHAHPQASPSPSNSRLLARHLLDGDSTSPGIHLPVVEPNLSGYLHGVRVASPAHSPSTRDKSSPSRVPRYISSASAIYQHPDWPNESPHTGMSSPRRKLFP